MNKPIFHRTIKETNGIALIEVERDGGANTYHVVALDYGQVKSVLPSDMPSGGGQWVAGCSAWGVDYVSAPRSRSAARAAFNRITRGN